MRVWIALRFIDEAGAGYADEHRSRVRVAAGFTEWMVATASSISLSIAIPVDRMISLCVDATLVSKGISISSADAIL
ncbi:MAG: hypothetical protein BWY82_02535 [Verrucomicrobia bacterium ADurb.Bin474]|nr:MAG: hypothetical protein BWY82_02535 [Verrucomicrobia bacterium ADurb.Bin474]